MRGRLPTTSVIRLFSDPFPSSSKLVDCIGIYDRQAMQLQVSNHIEAGTNEAGSCMSRRRKAPAISILDLDLGSPSLTNDRLTPEIPQDFVLGISRCDRPRSGYRYRWRLFDHDLCLLASDVLDSRYFVFSCSMGRTRLVERYVRVGSNVAYRMAN